MWKNFTFLVDFRMGLCEKPTALVDNLPFYSSLRYPTFVQMLWHKQAR